MLAKHGVFIATFFRSLRAELQGVKVSQKKGQKKTGVGVVLLC